MRWSVWITLSNGTRSRFGIYDSQSSALTIAEIVGGVVEGG